MRAAKTVGGRDLGRRCTGAVGAARDERESPAATPKHAGRAVACVLVELAATSVASFVHERHAGWGFTVWMWRATA